VVARVLIRNDSYHDSVFLLRISKELNALPGVDDAVVAMATPHNKELLGSSGYSSPELDAAGPNDLVLAVRVDGARQGDVEAAVDQLLSARDGAEQAEGDSAGIAAVARPRTLVAALQRAPDANLALISVPGEYAAREARRALQRGLHVMLFSDNVSVENEVALKTLARERGLLMMGPDCGTAILNGEPLAFANVVRRGSIGVVGASGTGIQEIVCVVHRLGGGISQAIGTGGRDLSEMVGGLMTLAGIEALANDPATRVIVVVSKPPALAVSEKVIGALRKAGKPAVVHFVGAAQEPALESHGGLVFATSLAGAAEEACRLARVEVSTEAERPFDDDLVSGLARQLDEGALLRGLFCGGTTGQEAVALLERDGLPLHSNLYKSGPRRTDGMSRVNGHVVLDLGADAFTVGRPHPMIEPELRNERLAVEMENSAVGILLFDVLLGYGSHADPAGVLAAGIARARAAAASRSHLASRAVVAVASITGTDQDPQDLARQHRALESAGVVVMPDNRSAVMLAAAVLRRNT